MWLINRKNEKRLKKVINEELRELTKWNHSLDIRKRVINIIADKIINELGIDQLIKDTGTKIRDEITEALNSTETSDSLGTAYKEFLLEKFKDTLQPNRDGIYFR